MAEPSFNLGDGNWAGKSGNLLGYHKISDKFYADDLTFTRASTGTIVNAEGLIESVVSGMPRVDYLNNANGSLLLEPQRTNFCTLSNDFYNWGGGSSYITSNYATSPDGTLNASRCLFTNSGQIISIATAATGTLAGSVYIKGIDGETIQLSAGGAEDLITLTGEWQRLVVIKTNINGQININSYGGATARDFIIYGAQLEEGSYATSYIPTSGTTVTRLGENSSSSVLPNIVADFTFFVDFVRYGQYANSGVYNFAVKNSTDTDRISIYKSSSVGSLNVAYKIGGVTTVANIGASVGDFVHHKIAFVCNGTTVKVFKDGSLVDTKTGFLNSDLLTDIHLRTESISTTNQYGSKFRSIQFYLSALTDTELATLTTL